MRRGAEISGEADRDDQTEAKRPKKDVLAQRLYFNKVIGLPERYNANAHSLSEMLEIISPTASIHFNFMVSFPWLLEQYPAMLRGGPITLIVGERMGTDFTQLKAAVKKYGANNISVGRARLAVPFGTHHSKISIFESDSGYLHIIISTANLLKHDWENKTQIFFYCCGKGLANDNPNQKQSGFRTDLVAYMDEYRTSKEWGLIEYWRDRVANTDLSHVKAQIVYSVPGSHRGTQVIRYGHPRLRVLLKELFGNAKNDDFTYHALFSSIGTLGKTAHNWLTGQFLCSLAGGTPTAADRLQIIYPCVEDVRNSNEGYEAGSSLPYASYVAAKQPYLIKFMHKWRSDRLQRTQAIPHIKTYAAFAKDSSKPIWFLITSANLSKAAWGDYQLKGTQLAIRSYEFGLLFTDPESLDMLPYDVPLTKYDDDDRPWIVDLEYGEPDIFQRTWP